MIADLIFFVLCVVQLLAQWLLHRRERRRFIAGFEAASERANWAANTHRKLDKELLTIKARVKVAELMDDVGALRMALQDLALFETEVRSVRDQLGK